MMYSNNDYRNYLAHHGVPGMKWGVRKSPIRSAIGGIHKHHKKVQERRKEKEINRYKTKYKLTDRQANTLYDDRKKNKYSKRFANSVAKSYKHSHGNITVAISKAYGKQFIKRAAFMAGAYALLGSPTGRRLVGNGMRYAIKSGIKAARSARKVGSAAQNAYWRVRPQHAPRQSVVDVAWKDLGPASTQLPAVIRRR